MRSTLILPIMGTMMYTISAAPVVSPRQDDPNPTKPMMSIGWIPYLYQPGKSTPQPEKFGPWDVILPRKDLPTSGDDFRVPCIGVCEPPRDRIFGVPAKQEIDLGNAVDVDAIAGDVDAIIEDAGKVMARDAPIVPDSVVSKIANAIDVDAEELEHDVQATDEEGTAFAHGAIDKLEHEAAKVMSAEPFALIHGAPHAFEQDIEAKAEAAIGELGEEVTSKGKAVEKAMANVAPGALVGAEHDIEAEAHASIKKLAPEMEAMEAHGAAILKDAEAKLQAVGLEPF
ncbi:hypothetical protein LTR97_004094 [Elasticomyces elasticus]|uniref:Uncharacterized protein n=1 Tax=Elasticomyces elasticus TaxID=574655 RepID=A0AAN8A402_9PEZI|nr:hypothetical protein LTR97_004094 [Elasticomyces elasticus]